MLRFLNIFKAQDAPPVPETMRARFERVTAELADVLGELEELPPFEIDPGTRRISFTAPEQFADEALALPSPNLEETSGAPTQPEVSDIAPEADAQAKPAPDPATESPDQKSAA